MRRCLSVCAEKMMELFEVPPDGVVTRKEFVDRIVDIFVQRRSLQLTLGDYEVWVLEKKGSWDAQSSTQ